MKPIKNPFSCLGLILIFFCSCCAKPILSNLQKGAYKYNTTSANILDVGVSVLPIASPVAEEEKSKTFFDLKDSLPYLYLKILSSKINDPDKFISFLNKPLTDILKNPGVKKPSEYREFKVQFAFSNLKKYYNDARFMHPNTRLEYLTTTLKIDSGSKIEFYNINQLQNEFDNIDLGNLSRDQNVSLNAKLSGEFGGGTSRQDITTSNNSNSSNNLNGNVQNVYDESGNVIGTTNISKKIDNTNEKNNSTTKNSQANSKINGEISYLNNQTIKEAMAVKLKRLKTGFNFSKDKLTIAQRGIPLGDISDNIYVTTTLKISDPGLSFSLNVYDFGAVFNESNNPVNADKLNFSIRNVNFIPCDSAKNVSLSASYEGAVRSVMNYPVRNGVNALEFDDKVTFYKLENTHVSKIEINKNIYCKNAYKIVALDKNNDSLILKIAAPLSEELDILDDDKPKFMLNWILEQLENPIPSKLIATKFKLYFENRKTKDRYYIVNNNISDDDILKLKSIFGITTMVRLPQE